MHRNAIKAGVVVSLLIFMITINSFSQEPQPRPKIGLALSGGGAKGLAHIGVLKVLAEIGMPIDYITGTSMGSIVAGLYAIGYKPDEIEKIAVTAKWPDLLTDEVTRRYIAMEEKVWDGRYMGSFPIQKGGVQLPSGLITGQKISNMLSRLTWSVHHINDFKQLPIPFTCVATDMITGEAVPIDSGFLPDAIRASMAIPSVFTPVKLQNRLLVDGGLVRNLPAEDVKNLGADIVIGVDVSVALLPEDQLNSFLDIITQSLSFVEAKSRQKQHQLCNLLIQPDLTGFSMFSFSNVAEIIQRGETAARAMLPRLIALKDSLALPTAQPYQYLPPQVDSILVNDLIIQGLKDVSRRLVIAELNMPTPGWISAKELDRAVARVYSSQFFERVTYQLIPSDRGSSLIIQVIEKSADLFRFGLRYDSKFKASLLLNTTFRNLAEHGSALSLDLRLGEISQFDVHYFIHTGLRHRIGLMARANYIEDLVDIYQDDQHEANLRLRSLKTELLFGTIFSTTAITGIGLRPEMTVINPRVAPDEYKDERYNIFPVFGLIWMDTFDRAIFPHDGQSFTLTSAVAHKKLGSDFTFSYHYLDWQIYYRVSPQFSLIRRLQLGTTTGSEIPLSYQFFLGGTDSFLGLKYQERRGRHLQALQLGIQYEVLSRRFIVLRGNIGNTSQEWKHLFIKNRGILGLGLTFGAASPIGPVELTLMGGNQHRLLIYYNIGFKF